MRVDRTLSIGLHRLTRRRAAVPVLMYHAVSEQDEPCRHPYFRTNTRPAIFTAHMRALRDAGYRAIPLDALAACAGVPADPVVALTFDDGFADLFTTVQPLLAEYGFMATVFLPTAFIHRERRALLGRPCLTWDEVRTLRAQGFRFGSHTVNHPVLHRLSALDRVAELRASRHTLEQELGESVTHFAYPYAFPEGDATFVRAFRRELMDAGYVIGVTTRIGTVQMGADPLTWSRLPMNSDDDERLFAAKLAGAYDWLGPVQRLAKRLRHHARPNATL